MTNYEIVGDWRIRINGMEHGVPHVHVIFRDGSRVSVAIETGEVLAVRAGFEKPGPTGPWYRLFWRHPSNKKPHRVGHVRAPGQVGLL